MRALSFPIFVIFFLLGACQQEADLVLPDQLSADSTYISRVIVLDTTKPSGSDTVTIYSYSYDQRKRLSQVVERDLFGGIVRPDAIYTIQYSGNDTLPFRYDFVNGTSITSSFYTYSGYFVVKDSTSGFDGVNNYKLVTRISQLRPGWFLLKSVRETDSNPGVFETMDSVIFSRTYSQGNIINRVDSVWYAGVFDYVESVQSQHDNNKGPFWRFKLFFNGYYESALPSISFPSLNNLTSESVANSSTGNIMLGASYTFTTAGYPSAARINGINVFNKYIFEYTHL